MLYICGGRRYLRMNSLEKLCMSHLLLVLLSYLHSCPGVCYLMSNEEVPCRIAAGSAQRSLSASLDNATPRRALCHRKGAWWMVKDQ